MLRSKEVKSYTIPNIPLYKTVIRRGSSLWTNSKRQTEIMNTCSRNVRRRLNHVQMEEVLRAFEGRA